jgi:2-methylisocitrate lyase-like PEP mutase family enzyme
MASQQERAERFRALHERADAFVIPNPWDPGSARLLAALGFEALATTSSGYAISTGRLDGDVGSEEMLAHCEALCAATDLPVSADLENGYAHDPEGVAGTIALAARTGLVGASIEDYTGDPGDPIYELSHAVERVRAAVEAAASVGFPFTLTARAENLIRGRMDLDDTIRRLQAFEAVGAQVLYAPGLRTLDEVRAVTDAVGRPVNVLAPPLEAGITVADLAEAGARRISIGGALARAAVAVVLRAGREMREEGGFGWTSDMVPGAELANLLGPWRD